MTITMFDSVDTGLLPPGYSYAGYVNGDFANYDTIRSHFPQAEVLSIAVNASADADCLDVESGDAAPGQAAAWVRRQFARKAARPCLYANASTMDTVLADMKTAGIARNSLRLWSAHYDGEHICGPFTCRQVSVPVDGTQWTNTARGLNLDQSLLLPDFFGKAVTSPVTYITLAEMETILNLLPVLSQGMNDTALPHWYIHRLQAVLNVAYGSKLTVDGVYGPATAAAVKTVQKALGLTSDSACGPATWARVIAG